ncbi:MAG: hydantoinase B/oxoprolinase family protein [bacterium]
MLESGLPMTADVDVVTVQVLREQLIGIVREMRTTMIRSAFSSAICELYDLSCALFNARGELVVQSEDNPQHIFPLLWTIQHLLKKFDADIKPGDVFIQNDPYEGGTHLNDIALITPYFAEDKLLFFPVVRAHWEDVGGATRGSISGKSEEIYQEGIRIPLMRIARIGETGDAILDLLFANMRMERERRGDFRAMEGTCAVACRRLDGMVGVYGIQRILNSIDALFDLEEKRMRARLSQLRAGEYRYEGYLDPRPDLAETLRIRAAIAVRGGTVDVDFSGSSKQMVGPYNLGPSGAPTGVFMMLKALIDPEGPVNSGSFRPIRVSAPTGTFINAVYPAAVGGMGDVRRALESVVMAALAPAVPERVTGETKTTANQVLIGGRHPRTGRAFLLYEAPAGGTGGFVAGDGNNTLRTFAEGDFTAVQPVEAIEQKFPVLVEECSLRVDSGGAGEHRGGLGMRRVIKMLTPDSRLSVVSDKNVLPPYGVFGGGSGSPNVFSIERDSRRLEPSSIPGKVANFPLVPDDRVVMESSGGGGYGDPLHRSPRAVQTDVEHGYVSAERARAFYGVVLHGGDIDASETTALRARLATRRVIVRASPAESEEDPRYPPVCCLHPATARQADLSSGSFAELLDALKPVAPHRVQVRISEGVAEGRALISHAMFRFLGWSDGIALVLRGLTAGAPPDATGAV